MSSTEFVPPHNGLVARNMGKTYGSITVLRGVNVEIRPGECVALLGENGAGKSTLSSIIAGLTHSDAGGQMWWKGRPYNPRTPGDALQAGIGLIHQEMRLLPHLTIAENVFVGRLLMKNGRIDMDTMVERAQEQLHRLGLNVSARTKVSSLSVAAQQQVEIAKALTLNATMLILDEPTAALGEEETDRLFEQVKRLKAEGVSFIYVSHRLAEIARICDRIEVLRDGRLVASHASAQLERNLLVRDMVGRNVDRLFPEIPTPPADAPVALSVRKLTAVDGRFKNLSFDVRRGEVLGFAGISGAGRTEAMRAIAGVDPIASGEIVIDGKNVRPKSPIDVIRKGLVMVPDDRKALGVVLSHSIAENIAYSNADLVGAGGWIWPKKRDSFAQELIRKLTVKGVPEQSAGSLSGGNQQKVVIAKWIARNPNVIILDEPTRGVDVGARAQIYEVIAELAREGMAVIVVSSDLDEVLGLSHRVIVLARGEVRGELKRGAATSQNVMDLAVH
ncbi:sugar ABC transporter ATP-binding protein [Rhodoferax sp. GW822-FHT02A01]|uniref:sugar ABC transporter ATP-binding protein n=1 Tax=Rhodoferax sp. GW822-FHT02A01 TaxID=3141537 RepID=UPI00315D4894